MTDTTEHRGERDNWDDSGLDETRRASPWAWLANGCGTAADRRNQGVLVAWILAWMLVYTAAAQTLKGNLSGLGLEVEGSTAWIVAVLPNLLAAVVLVAYLRFLRMTDELTRLIQLRGLAVGFGVWFFLSLGWKLLEDAGAAPLSDDFRVMIPLLGMVAGQLVSAWRYR